MSIPQIRTEAIEAVGLKTLMEYDPSLLSGQPCSVPIETFIETKFDLILEFHTLRKKPKILGETIFDDGAVVLYDQIQRQYRMIAVRAGTILIDERLCDPSKLGRLRFTCAHELAHWVLHKKLYSGTGDVAAYNGNVSSDESHGIIERQADTLASALLMPLPQIKKCFYRLRIGRTDEQLIAEMANIFEVSKQAIQVISNQYAERLLSEAEKTETYRGLSKIDILHTVSIPQLARTIPLKGLNLSLEKYRMPDGVIIEVESSSHYLGSFSEKNDSSTNWIEKIMGGVGIH